MKTIDDRTPPSDALTQQAWTWLRKLDSGDVTQWEARAFKRWLRASPAHQAAFSEARQQWALLKPASEAVVRANPGLADRPVRERGPSSLGRRAFLGGAIGVAAVAGIAVTVPSAGILLAPSQWNADYRTGTGEQRTVELAEHVNVMLNTQTSIRRQMAGTDMTGIDLLAGEVALEMSAGKPFAVKAGTGQSIAQSGNFDVRYLGDRVSVSCINGVMQVKHPAGVRDLQGRQQIIYNAVRISDIASIEPAAVSAWRKGELVFNQTPLSQVIDEINRYRPGRVVLMNETAGRQLVSGSFDITLLDPALSQLEHTFGLHARRLPAGLYFLS